MAGENLLDSILDTHHAPGGNGGLIVAQEHDLNKINFVAGLSDPGEMIRCGYLPQIRRRDGEQDKEYAARILPIVMKLPKRERDVIMRAAQQRAGLDTSTGKIAFAGVGGGWTGLGVNVSRAMTSAEARSLASLDWLVEKMALTYLDPLTDEPHECDDVFALVRQDTGAKLGHVGSDYKVIQNDDGFDFLDDVIGKYGARYDTAGAVHGGKKVFMTVLLPNQAFKVGGKDLVLPYGVFTNPHDGSGKAHCYPTEVRPECWNTLRRSIAGIKGKGIGLRHTGDIKARINDAKQALGIAVESFEGFKVEAQEMAVRKVKIERYASDVLDAAMGVTLADMNKEKDLLKAVTDATIAEKKLEVLERKIERRANIIEEILESYHMPDNGTAGMRGTVWAGLNAVTRAADHGKVYSPRKGTEEAKASRGFESRLYGDGDDLKQAAYQTGVAALKV